MFFSQPMHRKNHASLISPTFFCIKSRGLPSKNRITKALMTRAPFGYRSTHCWVMVKHPAKNTQPLLSLFLRKKQWFYNINNGCYVEPQHIGGLWLCQYQMISHESCLHDLFNGFRLAVKIRHDLLRPLGGQYDL